MDLYKIEYNGNPGEFDIVALLKWHSPRPSELDSNMYSGRREGCPRMAECEVLATTDKHAEFRRADAKKFYSGVVFGRAVKLDDDDDLMAYLAAEHKSELFEKIIKGEASR